MSVRFTRNGPEFPSELVDSILSGEVVFSCGTGISAPQMPDFQQLVERTYEQLGVERDAAETRAFEQGRYEEVLGSLSRRLADPDAVTRVVSQLLAVPEHPCLSQHRTILRLSRDLDNRISVVTTNFDTLLERAAIEVLPKETVRETSFAGQALPSPGTPSYSGIVHIHGRLSDGELGVADSQLVLTSADYGDAYMRSGWAARFLFDLARCKTIVLVGYSANDAPVRYLLNVLEADRIRFPDLKPVYAFDAYERDLEEATFAWRTLAVTPLPYCKVNTETGKCDHASLWGDLELLANVVERPKRSRRERAHAILKCSLADTSDETRRELRWLFSDRRDLWSVALDAIVHPEWFEFFQSERLWTPADCMWVIASWIAKDFQDGKRFECAREWQERLGAPFTEKVRNRLLHAGKLDATWSRVWKLFSLGEVTRHQDIAYYEARRWLAGGVVLDSDLRSAVSLLSPKLVLSRRYGEPQEEKGCQPIRGIADLVLARMVIADRRGAEEIVDALNGMPDHAGRILELATSELRSALALEVELEQVGEEHDFNDSSVPSIESHDQNKYREGVNFLVRALVTCIQHAANSDRDRTKGLVAGWRQLPGRIGLRLCLHAMRDSKLFHADEGMLMLLSASDVDFWSVRRELALLLKDRAADASEELLSQVEKRIRESGSAYYDRYSIAEGEPDWRAYARDAVVWLRLRMLQDAGVLSELGKAELSAIVHRRKYLDREVEERDFFGSYSFGVRQVVGDPEPIARAPEDDRLRVAQELATNPDLDMQHGWAAFCRSDPQGAFDSLAKGNLTRENGALWSQFLGRLAFGEEADKTIREDLAIQALHHLSSVSAEVLQTMLSGLCDVLLFARREDVRNVDRWIAKLWHVAVHQPEDTIESVADLYEKAINTPAGKITQVLLLEIEAHEASDQKVPDELLWLVGRVCKCTGVSGRFGRAILAHYVAFLLTVNRQYCSEEFGPCISAESEEGAALRAVMIKYGSITPEVTRVFGQAILSGVCESEACGHHAASIAANILRPTLSDLRGDNSERWGISAGDVAGVLRRATSAIREGVLEILAAWVRREEGSNEQTWEEMIVPFFERVWPKEREFRDACLTRHFMDLLAGVGCRFPMALEFLQPYISPFSQGHGSLFPIIQSDVPEKFPHETLELIWLVCGPRSRGSFYEISDVIDRIIQANPDIEVDRRLQWLEYRAERYD